MTNRFLRCASALLCCAVIPVLPAAAQTPNAARAFDLPTEPLARALVRFTRASGVIVVADASLMRGKRSGSVQGDLNPKAALDQMLHGTGLEARPDGRGGYGLVRTEQTVSPAASATVDPMQAEILVFGRLTRDTALSIPQTVDVIDSQLIQSSNSDTVGDALRFVPGASRDGSTLDAFGDTYLIRGFLANQTINGIAVSTMRQPRDSIGIERIEVLKGPASVLYGQLQPGAVVNVVTKQPKREWAGSASVSYGRYDDFRGTVDLTGPVTKGGALRFRVTGAYDDADSFIDYWHRRHVFVAPVLAVDAGDATTVTLEGMYSRNRLNGFFNGLPAEGTVLPNPNGRFARALTLTDPTFRPSIRDDSDITARVEHAFSDRIRWRTALSWMHEYRDEEGVLGLLGWADDTQRTLSRAVLASVSSGNTWTAHTDLGVGFETGPFSHDLVAGGEYTWFDRHTTGATSLAPDLDLFAPTHQMTARPTTTLIPSRSTTNDESTRTAGLFAQDRVALTDQIKLIAGVRWSDYRQTVVSTRGRAAALTRDQSQTAWTTQFGLLYTPTPSISLFANRTTSFLPVQGIRASGEALKPETGTQYEVGAKAVLLGGAFALNGSLFHLKRGDVAVADRVSPGFLVAIGEQVAKGFELSATGRPIDGLTLYAGYAYMDAKTTEDNDAALIGKRIRNTPEHSVVLRGDYDVRTGPLVGVSFGGSATYTGDRAADIENSFSLPSYWRIDAQIGYAVTRNVKLGASLENLTDERYYSNAYSLFEVWPGAPRTWRVNLTTKF
ncbi:TonB-dependent siderophore receptor [Sphingomonas panacis]|uniref:TonB-dependent siderophore receptor n=1 Tax=Sphingomonas panacis TaxID=1560345 RepID=UPI000A93875D|nr:TonB-dependent receptor [Sphingomonas panacis]